MLLKKKLPFLRFLTTCPAGTRRHHDVLTTSLQRLVPAGWVVSESYFLFRKVCTVRTLFMYVRASKLTEVMSLVADYNKTSSNQ